MIIVGTAPELVCVPFEVVVDENQTVELKLSHLPATYLARKDV